MISESFTSHAGARGAHGLAGFGAEGLVLKSTKYQALAAFKLNALLIRALPGFRAFL
jgi:hypothetical protein